MAGICEEQRLGRNSPLHVPRRGKKLVEAGSSAVSELRQSGCDETVKNAGAESSCQAAERWLTKQGQSAQDGKKNPAIPAHPDDRGSRRLGSERTLLLKRFHSIVKF
jgi:hypothetical protein